MANENEFESDSNPKVKVEVADDDEEEDLVDPHDTAKEVCAATPQCMAFQVKLDECNARVEGKQKTSETCHEELVDWMHCVHYCAAKGLFAKLK